MRIHFKYLLYLALISSVFMVHAGAYEDFFRAARADDAKTVHELLTRGFDPNAVDESGQPALTLAAREGALRVAEALLARPELKLDAKNRAGETPLMKGRASLVKRLLELGAAVNQAGWSPLHYAATGPDSDIVRLLVERGAALDAPSPNATTPLMMAAQYGSEASVQLLLARGADPSLRNERGLGAADFARLAGREQLAQRLQMLRR
jgi:uncharacterized protein